MLPHSVVKAENLESIFQTLQPESQTMAECQHFQSLIESQLPLQWNFDDLQAADQDMFDDNESELSYMPSSASPMDIDMEPFGSDQISHPDPDPDRFSVQFLLPLEVRHL